MFLKAGEGDKLITPKQFPGF